MFRDGGGASRKKYDLIKLTSEEGIIDMIRGGVVLQEKIDLIKMTKKKVKGLLT